MKSFQIFFRTVENFRFFPHLEFVKNFRFFCPPRTCQKFLFFAQPGSVRNFRFFAHLGPVKHFRFFAHHETQMFCAPLTRLSQSPFQFSRFVSTLGKDFSPLQRAKSTGGFFDRGVPGGVSLF